MEIVGCEVYEARSLLASADGWFTKEETFKQIKEIMSKKPLTLSDKCKKYREEHLELKIIEYVITFIVTRKIGIESSIIIMIRSDLCGYFSN